MLTLFSKSSVHLLCPICGPLAGANNVEANDLLIAKLGENLFPIVWRGYASSNLSPHIHSSPVFLMWFWKRCSDKIQTSSGHGHFFLFKGEITAHWGLFHKEMGTPVGKL